MRSRSTLVWTGAIAMVAACGSGVGGAGDAGAGGGAEDAAPQPGNYQDPLVQLDAVPIQPGLEGDEARYHRDGRVLVCSNRNGLMVYDVGDPTSARALRQIRSSLSDEKAPRCQHVAFDGDLVYFTSHGDEFQPLPFVAAIDLSSGEPVERDVFSDPDLAFEGIAAGGGLVYQALHADGLTVLSWSGDSLIRRGTVVGLGNAWGVAAAGTTVYVADGTGGLAVIDAGDPDAPRLLGRVELGGTAVSVAIDPDRQLAFVAASAAGLAVVDVSDPAQPAVLSTIDTPGTAVQVSLSGQHAFVADWSDFRAYDVSDPSAPRQLASERIPTRSGFSRVLGIAANDDVAYVAEWRQFYSYQLYPDRVAPDLLVSSPDLDLGEVPAGEQDAIALIVENQGTAPLYATSLTVDDQDFAVDPHELFLAPGEQDSVELVYSSPAGQAVAAHLTITSDDPDEGALPIALAANLPVLGVGDPAPEVTVSLLSGGEWKLSEERGQVVVLAYFATY